MREIELGLREAATASAIQSAIDGLGPEGGRVLLPAAEIELDRGLELRSDVELAGRGEGTVLRKAAGRRYPLTGYHNYGMCDVPLNDTRGLEPGMSVSVQDDLRGGFYGTFARITWVEKGWVGLDHGIEADYLADAAPALTLAFPLVFAHSARGVSIRNLSLDGNRAANPDPMNGCRGGAVYFARCADVTVAGVHERDFHGEGLSFQMCARVTIEDSSFSRNAGNGLHPGAGSTGILFRGCRGEENDRSGFFFCVRANHITVRACTFARNCEHGVSIGARDCHNLIEDCTIEGNAGAGIWIRPDPAPIEVHSCRISRCRIGGNGVAQGLAQVEIAGSSHDLVLENNEIRHGTGIRVRPGARAIDLRGNRFSCCAREVEASPSALVRIDRDFACGHEDASPHAFRHLPPPAGPQAPTRAMLSA